MSDPVPATRLDWRRGLQWFGAQVLVVVAGVLVALSLDAWLQGRQEVKSESNYLALLSRDVARSITDLEQVAEFEARQLEDAIAAQRALAQVPVKGDTAKLSEALSRLLTRQTMVLKNSTYLDLVSTGHLTLIRDAKLRDEIVDFYQVTGQRFEVINRNNAYYVDNVYNTNVIMSGLIHLRLSSNHPVIAPDFAMMAEKLGPDFTIPRDRLWSLSPDAPEWAMVRSSLMGRTLVSTSAIRVSSERLQVARNLKAAIDAALAS